MIKLTSSLLVLGFVFTLQLSANPMPQNISDYLETASVTERGFPSGTQEQIDNLANYIAENMNTVVNDFGEIAPDARRQNLLLAVSEFMAPLPYVQFLEKLVDKLQAQQGGIDAGVIEQALNAGTKKMGFLAFNFQHQAVVDLCQKAKAALPQTSGSQQMLTDVLSGEQRKQIGAALFMENLPQPETLPAE